ncbi:uncharacterized protein VTP21DRAFT_1375 [Calcarisporiella thermophila]|uniref:uncharacterized protein n=1 Tax=Calcarisporiella thermophila TaxID=911321 RepID=UPI0037436FDE
MTKSSIPTPTASPKRRSLGSSRGFSYRSMSAEEEAYLAEALANTSPELLAEMQAFATQGKMTNSNQPNISQRRVSLSAVYRKPSMTRAPLPNFFDSVSSTSSSPANFSQIYHNESRIAPDNTERPKTPTSRNSLPGLSGIPRTPTSRTRTATTSPLKVGDRVMVESMGSSGTLRFLGQTQFKPGSWAGVELDQQGSGKNDGSVQGVKYFDCAPKTGIFVLASKVTKLSSTTPKRRSRASSIVRPSSAASTTTNEMPLIQGSSAHHVAMATARITAGSIASRYLHVTASQLKQRALAKAEMTTTSERMPPPPQPSSSVRANSPGITRKHSFGRQSLGNHRPNSRPSSTQPTHPSSSAKEYSTSRMQTEPNRLSHYRSMSASSSSSAGMGHVSPARSPKLGSSGRGSRPPTPSLTEALQQQDLYAEAIRKQWDEEKEIWVAERHQKDTHIRRLEEERNQLERRVAELECLLARQRVPERRPLEEPEDGRQTRHSILISEDGGEKILELTDLVNQKDEQVKLLEIEVTRLQHQLKTRESEWSERLAKTEKENISPADTEIISEKRRLREKIERLERQLQNGSGVTEGEEKRLLKEKLAEYEEQIAALKDVMSELQRVNNVTSNENRKLMAEHEKLIDAHRHLETELIQLMDELERLHGENSKARLGVEKGIDSDEGHELEKLKQQLTEKQAVLDHLRKQHATEVREMREKIAELEKSKQQEISSLSKDVAELESLVEAKIFRESDLEEMLEAERKQVKRLKEELSELRQMRPPIFDIKRTSNSERVISSDIEEPERLYCDICDVRGHDIVTCKATISDGAFSQKDTNGASKNNRPYCANCEQFGLHWTKDCPNEDETF